jgi:hypothetical protein
MCGAQCLTCGNIVGAYLPKKQWPASPSAWDETLSPQYNEHRRAHDIEERKQKTKAWWAKYNEYLRSPKWASKRRVVLGRDLDCQACLDRPSTQVHHLTYDHVFDEPLFDLVGVCAPCHDLITNIDRKRRAGE